MGLIDNFSLFGNWFNRGKKMIEGDYEPRFQNIQIGNENPVFLPSENFNDIYHRVAPLNVVISRIGQMFSNGKWKLYDSNGVEIEKSEILQVLNNPNVLQSGSDLLFQSSLSQDIYGNSYIYKNIGLGGVPKQLWVIPELEPKTTGKIYKQTELSEIIRHYELNEANVNERYEVDEIILMKGNDSGAIYGESKIKTLIPQISNIYQAYNSRNVLITERGGIGFVTIDGGTDGKTIPLNAKEKKEAERKWEKNYGINKGQRKTAFSSVPLKFVPTNIPTKDLMLFEEVKDDLSVICDVYGYNIQLLSNDKGATFTNAKEYEKQVYQNTIIPRAQKYASRLTKEFKLNEKGQYLKLDYSHVQALQENEKLKVEVTEKLVNAFDKLTRLERDGKVDVEIVELLKQKLKS